MMKKHIITLAGDIASGKDTIKDILVEKLGYTEYLASKIARENARNMNLTITEYQDYLDNNEAVERNTEKTMGDYGLNNDNLVVVARLGFMVMPFSFKVYLTVDLDVAAERLYNSNRTKEDSFTSIDDAKNDISERKAREVARYKKIYNIDVQDMSHYDLVLNTTNLTKEQVVEFVLREYNKWINE